MRESVLNAMFSFKAIQTLAKEVTTLQNKIRVDTDFVFWAWFGLFVCCSVLRETL